MQTGIRESPKGVFMIGVQILPAELPIKRDSLYDGSRKDQLMPDLRIYRQPEFPAIYKWQAIAFMRMEWPSIFQGENLYMQEIYPPELQPGHFVMAEGDTLLSYATVLKLDLAHAGRNYQVYGFGNMLTFPPFRRRGYGGQVLRAATRFIRESELDAGMLFCDPRLEPFYGTEDWVATHSPTRLGEPDLYKEYEPLRMMLFVSEKGLRNKADFETQPFYIESPW
jgi:hypothetical protein